MLRLQSLFRKPHPEKGRIVCGHNFQGLEPIRPHHRAAALQLNGSIMPKQRLNLALVFPIIGMFNQSLAHGIGFHVMPFFGIGIALK